MNDKALDDVCVSANKYFKIFENVTGVSNVLENNKKNG